MKRSNKKRKSTKKQINNLIHSAITVAFYILVFIVVLRYLIWRDKVTVEMVKNTSYTINDCQRYYHIITDGRPDEEVLKWDF